MNPDDYKKRDWLKDIFKDEYSIKYDNKYLDRLGKGSYIYDAWLGGGEVNRVAAETQPPRFGVGDLLTAGGIVALVVSMTNGMNGRQYGVMRDGELMNVDEVALGEWSAI